MPAPSPQPLFEEIIKRLACARRARRAGLPLDRGPRREKRALVARVLGRDARGQPGLRALEPRARVERDALHAAVQIHTASAAAAIGCHRQRRAGCRSASSGTPRATPSDSASAGPPRPAAAARARAASAPSRAAVRASVPVRAGCVLIAALSILPAAVFAHPASPLL